MSTAVERARIAAAMNLLRPEWPVKSIETMLENHHSSRPYHDLAVAAAWVATDPATKTPARLAEAGPWWAALHTSSTPGPPRFDRDAWRAEHVAGAAPAPADFRDQVHAARAAAPPLAKPRAGAGIGSNDRRGPVATPEYATEDLSMEGTHDR